MIRALTLLIPVLVPSWRFFAMVGPSPRVEYTTLASATEAPQNWQEFRPRPDRIAPLGMVRRLFWNPAWNEQLFVMSCAERFLADDAQSAHDQILAHIRAEIQRTPNSYDAAEVFLFRLILKERTGREVVEEEVYRSPPQRIQSDRAP